MAGRAAVEDRLAVADASATTAKITSKIFAEQLARVASAGLQLVTSSL
jgi:hypothetical protein